MKPVKQRHETSLWAYAVLEQERQSIGDDELKKQLQRYIIDLNLQRALQETKSIDDRVEIIRQAYEMRQQIG